MIAPRLKAIEEVSREGEDILLFNPGDSRGLAGKIIFLYKNRDVLDKLSGNGRSTVKGYKWEELIKRIVDFALTLKV